MKLAFIGGRDIYSVGGIENWMLHLSERLAKMGHEVIVFCESTRDSVRFHGDVKVVYVKAPRSPYFCKIVASYRATRAALKAGCQLIHYNVWPSAVWAYMAEKKGVPTLLMGHGFEWKRSKYNRLEQWLLRKMEERAARRHKHIILCSQEQTDWYVNHYDAERKVQTIPSAVNLPAPVPASAPAPAALVPDSALNASPASAPLAPARTLLYMGRISPEKNVDLLIRAFENVQLASEQASSHTEARLLIAGNLDLKTRYGRKIKAMMAANPHVEYVGEVSGEKKVALLRRADVFCLPSSIEGLSIALLEAAAYRIPIIASDLRSNHEALGSYAFWVAPGDIHSLEACLHRSLATSEEQLTQYVEKAYERVAQHYTWDKVAAQYEQYIRNLLDANRPAEPQS